MWMRFLGSFLSLTGVSACRLCLQLSRQLHHAFIARETFLRIALTHPFPSRFIESHLLWVAKDDFLYRKMGDLPFAAGEGDSAVGANDAFFRYFLNPVIRSLADWIYRAYHGSPLTIKRSGCHHSFILLSIIVSLFQLKVAAVL